MARAVTDFDRMTRSAATVRRDLFDGGPDDGCCFCAELAGERTEVHDVYPQLASRLVLETDRFVAMPSLGQLAPGHLLLVPREHVTSFGELDADTRREAQDLYYRLRVGLSRRFSPVVSFEHGSPPGASSGGCGIVHAHVHFVPIGDRSLALPCATGDGWKPSSEFGSTAASVG